MSNKLELLHEAYKKIILIRQDATRASGKYVIGPTSKGKVYFKLTENYVIQDISIEELKDIRNLINDFLVNVLDEII